MYGEVVPTYNFVGGNFLKFAYQVNNNYNESNLTYSLPRSAGTWTATSKPCNAWGRPTLPIAPPRCRLIICYIFTCPIFGQALIPGTPKLQKVADSAPSANRAKGFNPGTASGSAVYAYDKNGNLTTDPYKSITIQYNFLNLPRLVTKGGANISLRYDASGRKWSQTGSEGIREYVGGIEYVDQKIQSVQHGASPFGAGKKGD